MLSDSDQTGQSEESGDRANLIRNQEQKLSRSRGRGLEKSIIEAAAFVLKGASRHPDYAKFDKMPFLYEKLDG